ncbi:hypothetical protein [uncultured Winogradskyella sp.]|uniref:hypothetical protein n=1 Tax=uncultured Winogradskyella sp. TaxID=395353 RepID=UPI00262EF07D|nr:hypothetical protein [uncultured Winogradskyella sp.]
MNKRLAPTYEKFFGDYWVLWYSKSNSYSIVEPIFKKLLDYYLISDTLETFKAKLASHKSVLNAEVIAETFHNYLNDSNRLKESSNHKHITFDSSNRNISKKYAIKNITIQIYYDSDLVLKTIHPALAYLSIENSNNIKTTFDIYLQNEFLCLFKDEQLITCVHKRDYHLMQGKFIMHLLCTIHDIEEEDWIGTFHGSTIIDGNSSILFIGKSGKGKSTLCTLLASNDFGLLSDDVSPMLSENKSIYYNPLAVSIKEGAFKVLKPIVGDFDALPTIKFNKTKGALKYISCNRPKKDYYPCNAIVLVNYENNSKTVLEKASIKTILETIIPDSWLSPNPFHAKQFLDWLEVVNIYKLTYSDTKSVTAEVSKLFKYLNKN